MTSRDESPPGAPCWLDVMSSDIDASRTFYGCSSAGRPRSRPRSSAVTSNFSRDGERRRAHGQQRGSGMPDAWSIYLAVADAQAKS